VPGQGEFQPDAEPVQRRVPGPDQPDGGQRPAHAAQPVPVLAGFEGDVVAEPFGLLMRVGVTPDVDQQRGVVHRRPVWLTQSRLIGQPQRDQALAQDMLHRLAKPQVHAQRQRRDQLGQPDSRLASHPSHQPSLTGHDLAAGAVPPVAQPRR
jgi:hypothetical protein